MFLEVNAMSPGRYEMGHVDATGGGKVYFLPPISHRELTGAQEGQSRENQLLPQSPASPTEQEKGEIRSEGKDTQDCTLTIGCRDRAP